MGANIVRDLFASVRDVVGGRSGAYESKLKEARDIAMEEMKTLARHKNANAIVGIDVDYEVVREGMLMVAVAGLLFVSEVKAVLMHGFCMLCRRFNISWEMRQVPSIYREDIRALLYISGFELIMFRILVREM